MNTKDIIYESAVGELVKKLPTLKKHNYDAIDRLMKDIAKRHKITADSLHDLFMKKYHETPDDWIKEKLSESIDGLDIEDEVQKFVAWAKKRMNLQSDPEIELSYDTDDAQQNHHTGRHTEGSNTIWVYVKNRNLVDILRTVCHELTHVRQSELDMIGPDDSYPGSPIELLADMEAGKLIKIYGAKNRHIFQ